MVIEEIATEVFERVQPGQLDLHEGRLCLLEQGVGGYWQLLLV